MFCDRCGSSGANIHIVRMVDGRKVEEILCRECAKAFVPFDGTEKMMKMAFSVGGIADIQDALRDLLLPVLPELFSDSAGEESVPCPICGKPMSSKIDDHEKCHDKIPDAAPKDELEVLKAEMDAAVREELYEKAAEIRDKISAVKAKREAENN